MIEVIVVIGVLVVLVGVLVPILIKYGGKARLSTDIDTGKEIADAIMTVITDESLKEDAVDHATPWEIKKMDGDAFKKAVYEQLSLDEIKGKSKKDADGNAIDNSKQCFFYKLDVSKNKVQVYYGGTDEEYEIYPKTGSKLLK